MALSIEIYQAVKTVAMTNSVGQRVMHESYWSGRQNLRYDKMYWFFMKVWNDGIHLGWWHDIPGEILQLLFPFWCQVQSYAGFFKMPWSFFIGRRAFLPPHCQTVRVVDHFPAEYKKDQF